MATRVFSPSRSAPGLVFVSGQTPLRDDDGVDEDAGAQVHVVLDRIRDALREHGLGLDDVVKVTYFLTRIDDLPAVRAALQERWTDPPPAASLVEVSALIDPRFRIEIEAIAAPRG